MRKRCIFTSIGGPMLMAMGMTGKVRQGGFGAVSPLCVDEGGDAERVRAACRMLSAMRSGRAFLTFSASLKGRTRLIAHALICALRPGHFFGALLSRRNRVKLEQTTFANQSCKG